MRPVHWLFVLRLATLIALGTSVATLYDYLSPSMAFCSASGCGAVKDSGLGFVVVGEMKVPYMPILGVLNFALLFGLSMLGETELRRRAAAPLAYANGLAGVALIALQAFVIEHFCSLCLIVDFSCLVIATAALFLRRDGWDRGQTEENERVSLVDATELLAAAGRQGAGSWKDDSRIYEAPNSLVQPVPSDSFRLHRAAWGLLLALSLATPLLYPVVVKTSEVPSVITALYQPDKLNVVEFFDFQCPHCRALAPEIEASLSAQGDGVHFVRQYVPLRGHDLSREASRLCLCAEEQGLGEKAAHRLLQGPELLQRDIDGVRRSPQLDAEKLEACLASERPDARLTETRERILAADFKGLPTTYIGQQRVLGSEARESLTERMNLARSGKDGRGLPPVGYWALVGLTALALIVWGRVRRKTVTRPEDLSSEFPGTR